MKNKFYLAFILLLSLPAFGRSVLPDRIVTEPLNMFSKNNLELPNGDMEVDVSGWNENGHYRKNVSKKIIPKDQYLYFKKISSPVLQMSSKERSGSDREPRDGTAFHIGNNLVLTNHHVLDPRFLSRRCGDFQLIDQNHKVYSCKKVHYCSSDREHDLCLIEMKPRKEGGFIKPKIIINLDELGSLKLKSSYYPHKAVQASELLTAIGNSSGFGIHLSQGTGVSFIQQRLHFYAPITGGNSGGALLNDEDLVVGIVRAQSESIMGSDPEKVYNVALPSQVAIRLIREALQSDTETLEKFNQAVVE